jgi:hypothetical protein
LFTQKRVLLGVCFLLVGFFSAVSALAETPAGDAGYKLTRPADTNFDSGDDLARQSLPQGPQESTGTNGTVFNREKVDPTPSYTTNDVAVHENGTDKDSGSTVNKKEVTNAVTDPSSAVGNLPPTLTVSTAALLELHAMRKSAVDLCIQLPKKYRTHLPQCAEIFKDEIRLERLAKDHP